MMPMNSPKDNHSHNTSSSTILIIKQILSKQTAHNITEDLINKVLYFVDNSINMSSSITSSDYEISTTMSSLSPKNDSSDSVSESWFCGSTLQSWATVYAKVYHCHCAIAVCLFGIITNSFNIIVLTRKDMASAPINRILTALAWADMLLMMEYIPFVYYYNVLTEENKEFPFYGAVFIMIHNHFSQIMHTTSICLTLALAIWRYLAIGHMEKNHILCSHKRCTRAIIACFILPVFLCLPQYPTLQIKSIVITEDGIDYTLYHVQLSDLVAPAKNITDANQDQTLLKVNFWYFAIFLKLLPCLILIVISLWLIRAVIKAKKGRQVLKSQDNNFLITPQRDHGKKSTKYERRADRTTKMLVAILVLFSLVEMPQGLFALVIGLKGKGLFMNCYQHYGEIMDIMALMSGSINFLLYCCMNRMFRITFGQLFRNKILSRWVQPGVSDTPTVLVDGHKATTTTIV
ncbi:FMRFamide receptor-like [Sitophilus oryzae]|uniref:FMRFamide receptor-like n=1 Tax=Sitophilus oryzae TaxID=7048 RepID=A0A6J2YIU9_SITOR|nr:FMRFamide receptor-like [Sitophilus oryzae]